MKDYQKLSQKFRKRPKHLIFLKAILPVGSAPRWHGGRHCGHAASPDKKLAKLENEMI